MSETTAVVGVDDSPSSRAALEFAMDEAVRRCSRLQVIAVVQSSATAVAAQSPAG